MKSGALEPTSVRLRPGPRVPMGNFVRLQEVETPSPNSEERCPLAEGRWGRQLGVTSHLALRQPRQCRRGYRRMSRRCPGVASQWRDVGVERQVEITGPDALAFTNLLIPRDLTKCAVGQRKYVVITADDGGIINDPVLLRLGENHFWRRAATCQQAVAFTRSPMGKVPYFSIGGYDTDFPNVPFWQVAIVTIVPRAAPAGPVNRTRRWRRATPYASVILRGSVNRA